MPSERTTAGVPCLPCFTDAAVTLVCVYASRLVYYYTKPSSSLHPTLLTAFSRPLYVCTGRAHDSRGHCNRGRTLVGPCSLPRPLPPPLRPCHHIPTPIISLHHRHGAGACKTLRLAVPWARANSARCTWRGNDAASMWWPSRCCARPSCLRAGWSINCAGKSRSKRI